MYDVVINLLNQLLLILGSFTLHFHSSMIFSQPIISVVPSMRMP